MKRLNTSGHMKHVCSSGKSFYASTYDIINNAQQDSSSLNKETYSN